MGKGREETGVRRKRGGKRRKVRKRDEKRNGEEGWRRGGGEGRRGSQTRKVFRNYAARNYYCNTTIHKAIASCR